MIEDLPRIKAITIERCASRAREVYARTPSTFAADQTVWDAALRNIQRACRVRLDTGQHLIHRERLGALQNIDNRAHVPVWARIPAAPAVGREASRVRPPTLECRSHQTVHTTMPPA
ncbi:hypothetical protein D3C78_1386420 [compost metagenome]